MINPLATESRWRQVNMWGDDGQSAEWIAAGQLGPRLEDAEQEHVISSWRVLREGRLWRILCLPAHG